MQSKTIGELAEHVGGKMVGNPSAEINAASTLESAGKGEITFLSNPKYTNKLKTTEASAVVVSEEMESSASLIVVEDPYFAFREIVVLLHGHRKHKKTGISPDASIDETAVIGDDCDIHGGAVISENANVGDRCVIYPGVYVGSDTKIGNDCILYPNAVIFERCEIGNGVILQANASIGQDGFGFATHEGKHHKIPHIGKVILEDEVEIGANSSIERGTLDDTVIGAGSKLGDGVVIGHGSKIGKGCLMVPQVGIAGSAEIGDYCVIGGQAGVVGHIKVGNMVTIAAKAAVINDLPDFSKVAGTPAIDAGKAKRAYSLIETLPDLRIDMKKVKRRLDKLENKK